MRDHHSVAAWRVPRRRLEVAWGALAVLLSNAPLFILVPWATGADGTTPADAPSHAKVALELASRGLGHGWLDSYAGGFPLGHHYPVLGWLLLALGMRAGLGAATAVNALGFVGTLAAPFALYAALVRAGAKPLHAACGGCFLALVSPYNAFIGGIEVYFATGLVSQVVALPLCITFAAAVARGARAEATVFGALAMSAHPQVCGACVVLLAITALLDGARERRVAAVCAVGGAVVTGVALYGQGIRTLRVPFGWPPGLGWRHVGFGTNRLDWWFLDGDLLDRGSAVPVLTALLGAAALASLLLVRRRVPRALLLLTLAALLLSMSGPALLKLPHWGAIALELVQPLRVLSLLPPIFATLLCVALEEGTAVVRARVPAGPGWLARLVAWGPGVLGLCVLCFALPARVSICQKSQEQRRVAMAGGGCVRLPGFATSTLAKWFNSLRGGSLWMSQAGDVLSTCVVNRGLELQSAVPLSNPGAVGSHVGLLWLAAKQLHPDRAGAVERANAMGIRYVLQTAKDPPPPPGFVRRNVSGSVELWENPAAGLAHVGCVRERWTGSDRALRARLTTELGTVPGADRLLNPAELVELVPGSGEVQVERVERACDAGAAKLYARRPQAGELEALVESQAPLDLVFTATAFPGWRVDVDGVDVPSQIIAPGYVAVRLQPGRHHVRAIAGTMPGYGFVLGLGALVVAALAWLKLPQKRVIA